KNLSLKFIHINNVTTYIILQSTNGRKTGQIMVFASCLSAIIPIDYKRIGN
ncbi:MAG: hypothetical protein ACI85O_003587, partial [Saprospiraceae bacterium]